MSATGNNTSNSQALNRATVYSGLILESMKDGLLAEGIARDVSDFPDGSKLEIPTFGEAVLHDLTEGEATPISPIDTGKISLEITEHVGTGFALTDEEKEDGFYVSQFDAAAPGAMMRALQEHYETKLLETCNKQTLSDPNQVNRFAHRYVASGTGQTISIEDFAYAKTSLLKAKTPEMGLIAIVDPIHELTLNNLANLVNVSNNPRFEGIVETGFAKNMRFLKNIFGFDVYMSNRLPQGITETIDTTANSGVAAPSGSASVTDGIAIQFMCVADDMTMPYMSAWRRKPVVENHRNVPGRQDEYYTSARFGFGLQRGTSLVTCLTSADNY